MLKWVAMCGETHACICELHCLSEAKWMAFCRQHASQFNDFCWRFFHVSVVVSTRSLHFFSHSYHSIELDRIAVTLML